MKEITFLKQNAQKWQDYETKISEPLPPDPAELTGMFIEITDDLAYCRTNFKGSKTLMYVNGLAAQIHQLVYRNKKEKKGRLQNFFRREVPYTYGLYHRYLLYSLLITAVATLIGVVSENQNSDFVRVIFGDRYVDETLARIKQGNPVGIYGESNQLYMFVFIAFNNIKVACTVFVMGLFTPFAASYILVSNGIMLGAFFAMFARHGYLADSLRIVLIHGTLEISAIVLAGAAAFVLGNSYLFPGTHTRLYALMRGARKGLKMLMGLVPVFLVAAFLESFVTRYTGMPAVFYIFIISASLFFILGYFVVLPALMLKKKPTHENITV